MSRNLALMLLLVGVGGSVVRADPVILWEQSGGGGFGYLTGYYIPPEDRWVQCTFQEGELAFGDDLYWYESDVPAEHIWPDPDTPPQDWASFVGCLTNGSCDMISICCQSVMIDICLIDCDPDLSGCQIDYVRLYVESIAYDGEPPDISFSCVATWQIWGTPEPSSLLLLPFGAALAGSCRRRGRAAA